MKPGDTLWDIAKNFYGSGRYWPAIAAENPAAVKSKGDFILAGVGLKIPKISIPAGRCEIDAYKKTEKPTKVAMKKARPVLYPTFSYDLSKSKSVKTVVPAPGAKVIITTSLYGTLVAQKEGVIPANFNLRSYQTTIAKSSALFTSSVKLNRLKPDSISIGSSVSGTVWSGNISISSKGSIKVSLAPKPVNFKNNGITFVGRVGINIEIQIIPDPVKVPEPIHRRVFVWIERKAVQITGVGILVGASALVVGTLAEDIITGGAGLADDPVSFAAAAAMARQGLILIK